MSSQGSTAGQAGFSLTELMIVVVIIGVLAAIGLPAYQDYSRTSKRGDAHQALSRMAQLQERHFTDNNTYATQATQLGYGNDTPTSTGGYWQLSVVAGGATYQLQASPVAGVHSDPDCLTLTMDSTGLRGSTPGTKDCWSGR